MPFIGKGEVGLCCVLWGRSQIFPDDILLCVWPLGAVYTMSRAISVVVRSMLECMVQFWILHRCLFIYFLAIWQRIGIEQSCVSIR